MRKRERESACGICGHYHNYEEGEVCGDCGHRLSSGADTPAERVSAFSSEILTEFLYLGSFDNAARGELLKSQGISCILNTVPACQNLLKNTFTYHCLQYDQKLPFDDAIQFLEKCEKEGARVLVHCMSGKSRSPAIVIAYLMKSKGWKLAQSYQWVKERRPLVELNQAVYQQLQEFEEKIFGPVAENGNTNFQSLSFGFPVSTNGTPAPIFSNEHSGSASIFDNVPPREISFGAARNNSCTTTADDIPMDGS